MLRNTLILPESDARLAAKLLRDAIEAVDTVLMLVFGKGPEIEQIVRWADLLCNKTRMTPTYNPRAVVWIRRPDVRSVRSVLDPIVGEGREPIVAVLDFYDNLRAELGAADTIKPLDLELAFLEGSILEEGEEEE